MKAFSLFLLVLSCMLLPAQSGPRTWGDHLGLANCNTVAKLGSTIYASNGNALVYFDQSEINPKLFSKINGLSDVGIRLVRANRYNNKLLVIYDNCNIDVIDQNNTIRNYTDFKLKILSGKKLINEVTFYKQFAYLACGFGIVVFDTDKMEIKDTYYIGLNGANVDIAQVALNDSLIFAATKNGIYKSNFTKRNLSNFKSWTLDTAVLPAGPYSGIVNANGSIISAFSLSSGDATKKGKDTLFALYNNQWDVYRPFGRVGRTLGHLFVFDSLFANAIDIGAEIFLARNGSIFTMLNSFNGQVNYGSFRDLFITKDHTANISFWVADAKNGLYQTYGYYPYFPQNRVKRNGTNSSNTCNIDVYNGQLAVSPSNVGSAGAGSYLTDGLNFLKAGEWSYREVKDANGKPVIDVTGVLYDRKKINQYWASSWNSGVMQFRNDSLIKTYNKSSVGMPEKIAGEPRCVGLSMDKDGNLWFAQSDQTGYLSAITKTGAYVNLNFGAEKITHKTFVDKNNFVWALHDGGNGITVYKNTNFTSPVKDQNYKLLLKGIGLGNLQSNDVRAIAEDLDGKIWIGTAEGISVFYNPSSLFTASNIDAEPIKIVQDGNVELLLANESISAIVVDGANNKWVGTAFGGVYCFTSDGQTQLYHFTKENSPLNSNSIIELAYNSQTGDVFIASELGIQSFRSTILAGEADYSQVMAYPNPVKPNYNGTVLIKGLVDNSVVKITDVAGNMVWEVKSTGGQIEWPITNFSGQRVSSGVYVVYSATTTGELKAVSKILIVN
jgi:sugar lactone lactonase YvrE